MRRKNLHRAWRKLIVFWLRVLAWGLGIPGSHDESSGAYDPFDCWLNW